MAEITWSATSVMTRHEPQCTLLPDLIKPIGDKSVISMSNISRYANVLSCCLRSLPVLVAVLWMTDFLVAQYNLASLGGTVVDVSGAAVPGAKITAQNTDKGMTRVVSTGADGAFVIPGLPVGTYTVAIEKQGFTTQIRRGIVLTVDQAATLAVSLQVGPVSQDVTVAANAELVSSREATVGQLIDTKRIAELPLNGRHTQDLVFLSAGTVNLTS